MLREAVSSVGLTFFPICALLLFLIVYCSVISRSFLKHRKPHWNSMASMALDEPVDNESTPGAKKETAQ